MEIEGISAQRLFMGEVIPVQNVHHLILAELDIHVQLTETADALQKQLNKLLEPVTKRSGRIKFYNSQENWGRIFFEDDIYFNKNPLI